MNPFLEDEAVAEERTREKPHRLLFTLSDRTVIVIIIYVSLFLDNVLLTVIVPILPDFLMMTTSNGRGNDSYGEGTVASSLLYKKFVSNILTGAMTAANGSLEDELQVHPVAVGDVPSSSSSSFEDENVFSIGVLLSVKAFIQLAFNPIIGAATKRVGYQVPILLGTMSLVLSSFLFAIGENYYSLLFARAVQGIGSSCLGVCGMSLVATLYPEDEKRSKVMGVVLGSIALGVLIGYPVGGILYDFFGKSSPFWIICGLLCVVLCVQLRYLDYSYRDFNCSGGGGMDASNSAEDTKWRDLLSDSEINLISLAIFISTSAMAILEPCLPLWLITNLHPAKWQLGTVFIPDSLGYLIGTNGFGRLAYEKGQIRVAVGALIVIGGSCIAIPGSTSMSSLLIPHFGIGLGIGVLDAALVPYLSSRIDSKYSGGGCYSDCSSNDAFPSSYGTVYAIQQMAVSLAYSASPLLASEVVKFIGFPGLMFSIGVLNVVYAVLFYYFTVGPGGRTSFLTKDKDHLLATSKLEYGYDSGHYNRFYNSTN